MNKVRHSIDGTLRCPAASGLGPMHVSFDEYQHPALEHYLGQRELVQALTMGGAPAEVDEEGRQLHTYMGLVGHVTPSGTPSGFEVGVELGDMLADRVNLEQKEAEDQSVAADTWVVNNLEFLERAARNEAAAESRGQADRDHNRSTI